MSKQIRTPDLEQEVIKLYIHGLTAHQILDQLNWPFKSTKSIYDICTKYGVSRRDLSKASQRILRDSSYFAKVDTPTKAYILGLMITDGWICTRNAIGFCSSDKDLATLVSNEIANGSGITTREPGIQQIVGKTVNRSTHYQFQLRDKFLKDSLIRLGFLTNKTHNEFLPAIQESLENHILRGILDGDGCVYKLSGVDQVGLVFYSGSELFLKQISSLIYKHLSIPPPSIKPTSTIYKIAYYREADVTKLGQLIYKDSDGIKLNRKYNLWKRYHTP